MNVSNFNIKDIYYNNIPAKRMMLNDKQIWRIQEIEADPQSLPKTVNGRPYYGCIKLMYDLTGYNYEYTSINRKILALGDIVGDRIISWQYRMNSSQAPEFYSINGRLYETNAPSNIWNSLGGIRPLDNDTVNYVCLYYYHPIKNMRGMFGQKVVFRSGDSGIYDFFYPRVKYVDFSEYKIVVDSLDVNQMFMNNKTVEYVNLGKQNLSGYFNQMFWGCEKLKTVDFTGVTVSKYTSTFYWYMFYNCFSLTDIDLRNIIVDNRDYMGERFNDEYPYFQIFNLDSRDIWMEKQEDFPLNIYVKDINIIPYDGVNGKFIVDRTNRRGLSGNILVHYDSRYKAKGEAFSYRVERDCNSNRPDSDEGWIWGNSKLYANVDTAYTPEKIEVCPENMIFRVEK